MSIKYPKTPHLPWSESINTDDIHVKNPNIFKGMRVVVTEKLDGENTTMTKEEIHARSIDSLDHPSRHWVKGLHGRIKWRINPRLLICGENVYAKHSIFYKNLETYFYVFAMFYFEGTCLNWQNTKEVCKELGLTPVPVIYEGVFDRQEIEEKVVEYMMLSQNEVEGYVIRNADTFKSDKFHKNVAKWVRRNHVTTSDHWKFEKIVQNQLIDD